MKEELTPLLATEKAANMLTLAVDRSSIVPAPAKSHKNNKAFKGEGLTTNK